MDEGVNKTGAHSAGAHSMPQSKGPASGHGAAPNKPQQKKNKKRRRKSSRRISNILLIFGVILLALGVMGLGKVWFEYKDGADRYKVVYTESGITEKGLKAAEDGAELEVDWEALRAINPDVVGWVWFPGIEPSINYPVVQTDNNDYYLTQSYDGDPGKYGSIFMDCDSLADLSDYHTIIYGHHLRNGEMFAQLANYTDEGFFNDHQQVIYATPEKTHHLQIIGAYALTADDNMRQTIFSSPSDYYAYVQDQLDKSAVTPTVDATEVRHLYSFVTCSYSSRDERTVVLAYEPSASDEYAM